MDGQTIIWLVVIVVMVFAFGRATLVSARELSVLEVLEDNHYLSNIKTICAYAELPEDLVQKILDRSIEKGHVEFRARYGNIYVLTAKGERRLEFLKQRFREPKDSK